jgi:Zn-dependent M32 family carboxypeptidase
MSLDKHSRALVEHLSAAVPRLGGGGPSLGPADVHAPRRRRRPRGGLATLSRLSHGITASDETARLLDAAGDPKPGSDAEAAVRVARRARVRATKLPSLLVAEISRATTFA